jgi:hypothetical protein
MGKQNIRRIHSWPLLFQIGDQYVFVGRDFLGMNGTEVASCSPSPGTYEKSVLVGGKEIRIQVETKREINPNRHNVTFRISEKGPPLKESIHTLIRITGIVAHRKNWPLMLFKPKQFLISHYLSDSKGVMTFLRFDRAPLRILNKQLKELSNYGEPDPWLVWNYRYQDGPDHIKLVYLEYRRKVWESVEVANGRQYLGNKITPVNFHTETIYLLRPSRFNSAAELWVYRNGKRTESHILNN